LIALNQCRLEAPAVLYNRLMGQVLFDDRVRLSTEGPLDESMLADVIRADRRPERADEKTCVATWKI